MKGKSTLLYSVVITLLLIFMPAFFVAISSGPVLGMVEPECSVADDCPQKCTQESHKLYTQVECSDFTCDYSKFACVVGECGAGCDGDADCGCPADRCEGTTLVDYPEHGYCGTAGSEGCLCQADNETEGQCMPAMVQDAPECMPECFYIGTIIDRFHGGLQSMELVFPAAGPNTEAGISYDFHGIEILSATLEATGLPLNVTDDVVVDAALVQDVSGSMDDDCGPDGIAQPGETPCKINDKKAADISFASTLLGYNAGNMISIVAYSNEVVDSLPLTNNISIITDRINSYSAAGTTCISCGIEEGIQLLKQGSNSRQVMILMSDEKANECIDNPYCTLAEARQEAIEKAAEAWESWGIMVYAVAYGWDADAVTLQEIADAGHGKYYFADNFNITGIYNQIASEIVQSYPYNPSMDAGGDGVDEWAHAGLFDTAEGIDFAEGLKGIAADCNCPGCSVQGEECVISLEFLSESAGIIMLDELNITACSYVETDGDGDGYNAYVDCDDANPDVHPGAEEVCNGMDDDCDGYVDNAQETEDDYTLARSCALSFAGICGQGTQACGPEGWYGCPAAKTEVRNGLDDDCDGSIDEGLGGGGSGGIVIETAQAGGSSCEEEWTCSGWSECTIDGIQARECSDSNGCGTEEGKPAEEQACTYEVQETAQDCEDDDVMCLDAKLYGCVDGGWEVEEDCQYGCAVNGTACAHAPEQAGGEVSAQGDGVTGMMTAGDVALYGIVIIIILALIYAAYRRMKK